MYDCYHDKQQSLDEESLSDCSGSEPEYATNDKERLAGSGFQAVHADGRSQVPNGLQ